MKIKVRQKNYADIMAQPPRKHIKPKKQHPFFRLLFKVLSRGELKKTRFTYETVGMEKLGKKEPCLVLMNHSSFIDLKIASTLLAKRRFNIVCTSDGLVGKEWLMRAAGCIPTTKFISDVMLLRDMKYAIGTLKSSILMYPEASYSFDGTATALPDSIGGLIKLLGVPVVMIRTYGAFAHDPLYNGLRQRDVTVSATMEYLLSPEDIAAKSAEEIRAIMTEQFTFDHFRWQDENQVKVDEPFRAEGLNRVLYKCPHCMAEGRMQGKGVHLSCSACGKRYRLTEYGRLEAEDGQTEFSYVTDWYAWEREMVRREIACGAYRLDTPVDIMVLTDPSHLWRVGEGHLVHDQNGFLLTGCDGTLTYRQKPQSSYSLYSDFYWYEIGDVICIGNPKMQYYCFPKIPGDIVAKTRLAAEEMYKTVKAEKK